jgi:hypothetical protein
MINSNKALKTEIPTHRIVLAAIANAHAALEVAKAEEKVVAEYIPASDLFDALFGEEVK